jgi:hypothetical protein
MIFIKSIRRFFCALRGIPTTPKVLQNTAQGCEERATLGLASVQTIHFAHRAASEASISVRLDESGAVSRKLITWLSIPFILVGLAFGWWTYTGYKLNRERAAWKTRTLKQLTGLSITNGDIVAQLEPSGLKNWGDHQPWIGEHVLLMTNHEYLVFSSRHGFNNGFVDHLFLARGSDGHWYYSTYHFCNEMAGVIGDEPPGSIAEFASRYSAREFDGKSDVCLEHTWPPYETK